MNDALRLALEKFDADHIGRSKGALSLALILTRAAKSKSFPLQSKDFETPAGGQVAGTGGAAIAKILKEHGIERILSTEGGRTSRGGLEKMRAYVGVLNELQTKKALDLSEAENWWVERVQDFFASSPFSFKFDPARSLSSCVRDLLTQAVVRQRESKGTMYAGAVMQHLVGAKLDWVSKGEVEHHGFSVADAPSNRRGDFIVGDVAIHVTTAPTEALIKKCESNLSAGLRPLIVTTRHGVGGAMALAEAISIDERVDIIDIEQFLAANIYERSVFNAAARPVAIRDLIDRYNSIVSKVESDPSLRIEFEG
jgi:hypothetical protein